MDPSLISTAALFVMMFAIGMTLELDDFRRLARYPKAVAFGLVGQLVMLPALAFGIAFALSLPSTLGVGLVLIAACPGGVTSNVLTRLARGDVALSISLTAASSLVAFITVPWLVALALEHLAKTEAQIALSPRESVVTLFSTTALPLAAGMVLLRMWPAGAGRLHRPLLGVSTVVLFVLIVGLGFSISGSQRDWTSLLRSGLPAVALLVGVMSSVGIVGARLLRLPAAQGRALAIELGIQNFNLALVVALRLLNDPRYVGPALLYLPLMLLAAGIIVLIGRRGPLDGHEQPAPTGQTSVCTAPADSCSPTQLCDRPTA